MLVPWHLAPRTVASILPPRLAPLLGMSVPLDPPSSGPAARRFLVSKGVLDHSVWGSLHPCPGRAPGVLARPLRWKPPDLEEGPGHALLRSVCWRSEAWTGGLAHCAPGRDGQVVQGRGGAAAACVVLVTKPPAWQPSGRSPGRPGRAEGCGGAPLPMPTRWPASALAWDQALPRFSTLCPLPPWASRGSVATWAPLIGSRRHQGSMNRAVDRGL